jgi:uncharacterized membrane protein (UPF0127 family)
MPRIALIVLAALLSIGCGSNEPTGTGLNVREVTLPNGTKIRCEVMARPEDMARGMMHRDALPPDRGMLFLHAEPGRYAYWMHNVRVPLDIVWMDRSRRIVEIAPDTPGCLKTPQECPSYGGNAEASYVLELAGGGASRHGLKLGDVLSF